MNWNESLGSGLRRDHRADCASSHDRKPGRRCDCPISFWIPDPSKREGRSRVKLHGTRTLAEAKLEKQRLIVEARQRIKLARHRADAVVQTPILREWATRCMHKTWRDLSPSTREKREASYRLYIDRHFGHLPIDRIDSLAVSDWLDELQKPDGTRRWIELAAECLRAMLNVAIEHELLTRNPVRRIPRTPRDSPTRRKLCALTPDEYEQLKNACTTNRDLTFVRVATECLLRRGELAELRWHDIDFDNRRIHVTRCVVRTKAAGTIVKRRKAGSDAHPAMSPSLVQLLRDYQVESIARYGAMGHSPVWPGRNGRAKLSVAPTLAPSSLGHWADRLFVRSGLVDADGKAIASLHDLRRTGASIVAARANVPAVVIQHQLGHSTPITSFRHYVRRSDEGMQDLFAEAFE